MYSSQPAINPTLTLDPISLPNQRVLSLLCQSKHLFSKRRIVGIGGRQGKRAAIGAFEERLSPCAEAREVEPERGISQERAFLLLLRGAEDLQRGVNTGGVLLQESLERFGI